LALFGAFPLHQIRACRPWRREFVKTIPFSTIGLCRAASSFPAALMASPLPALESKDKMLFFV
ncbi:hypothetical protein, partial [Collimonas pratensis]|uniref:hypothetical protein n=1 Tax=Collimonas pratensis TaxID=279113 RepID=UPI00197E8251